MDGAAMSPAGPARPTHALASGPLRADAPVGVLELPPFADEADSDDSDDGELGPLPPPQLAARGENTRSGDRRCAPVRAWHDAVPSAEHRVALAVDARKVLLAARGETFWVDEGTRPQCALEALSLEVLRYHTREPPAAPARVCGAEWWVQVRSSDGEEPTIKLHWDSDETHKAAHGEHLPPWIATVTYLGCDGAPTVVFPAAADAHGRSVRVGERTYLSYPRAGKHLAFDGRLLHGALHELATPSVAAYKRVTLLVNVWVDHTPDCVRLPAEVAATLLPAKRVMWLDDAPVVVASESAAGAASAAWTRLHVGFTPRRALCQRTPGWRRLAIGFPFFHPPMHARHLPTAPDCGALPPSVSHALVELKLPFDIPNARRAREETATGATEAEPPVPGDATSSGGDALLLEAAAELKQSGDRRALRAMRGLVGKLPNTDDVAGAAGESAADADACASIGESVSADAPLADWAGGEHALRYLAREGLEACALCALARCGGRASLMHHLDAGDADGFTSLHFACNMGLRRLVHALIEAGASVHAVTRDVASLNEPGGRTPLHLAASAGQAAGCYRLLDAHALLTAEDWLGASPLQLACRRGHHGLAAELSCRAGVPFELPIEQELRGFELAESIAMRQRNRQRRAIYHRPGLRTPFVMPAVLTRSQSSALVRAAERAALGRGGWQSARHRFHSTVDLPVHDVGDAWYARLRRLLDCVVLPRMSREYDTAPLCVREAFVVKYQAATGAAEGATDGAAGARRQAGLAMHRDGTLLNCVILLANPDDFEGGGTVFAPPLDRTYQTGQGDCLCSCGQLRHGAAEVTSGIRYVLIAFIDEQIASPEDDNE